MHRMTNILGKTLRRNKLNVALDAPNKLKACRHGRTERTQRTCYRYVRLLPWIFLFLYLCSSGQDLFWLVTSDWKLEKNALTDRLGSGIRNTVVQSGHLVSNAILEENEAKTFERLKKNVYSDDNNNNDHNNRNNSGVLGLTDDVKIYVYDLPSKYNQDWLVDSRCSNHLFAAEVAIHRVLMNSSVRVLDPLEADFFFVPVYVSCNFSVKNGFPSLGHARPLLSSAVEYISEIMPYWNRSGGTDHIFVATHDYGACFHAMEDVAIDDGIPSFLQNSIILQTFGVKGKHPCQDVEHVQIPPYVSPKSIQSVWTAPEKQKRDIWVFFRGKMEIHPKNISGRIYSKGLRTAIWQKYGHNRKFYIKRKRYSGYQTEILRSVFCLCPLGWAPWSPRIVESVALGCIPVIIADNISLPYSNIINWPQISLTVPEKDIGKLGKVLEKVTTTNLTSIQRNLWHETNRRALLFTEPLQHGDATWQILQQLTRNLDRSHRKKSLSSFV